MTVLDRVPVDRISEQAREIHPGRTLLTLIALVLYAPGWIAGTVLKAVWVGVAWTFAAVKVGWQDARGGAGHDAGSGRKSP